MNVQHFFLEGRYLGKADKSGPVGSIAYYCHLCGEVWAKLPVEGPDPCCVKWRYFSRTCRKCGERRLGHLPDCPGSILDNYLDRDLFEEIPPKVMQWEFERQLENYDRRTQ